MHGRHALRVGLFLARCGDALGGWFVVHYGVASRRGAIRSFDLEYRR